MPPPALSVSLLHQAGSLAAGAATQRSGRAPPPVRGANRRQRQQTVCKNRIVIIAIQEPILGEPPPARSMGGRPAGQGPPAQVESCLPPPERSNADEMVKRRHSRQGLAAGTVKRRRNGRTPKK